MDRVIHLINWKMRLAWRMYVRNTLASLESILFLIIYITWMIFSYHIFIRATNWGLSHSVPQALIFCNLFTFLFVIWLIFSFLGYRLNESYDLNRLYAYPLPLRSIFSANLFGAFLDLSVLLPLVSYIAILVASIKSAEHFPVAILLVIALLFLQVAAGLTLVNVLYVLLPRLNLVKVGMWAALAILVWEGLLNRGIIKYPMPNFYALFREFGIKMYLPYPAGQIGIALDAYITGNISEMTIPLLGFAGWTIGILTLNYLILNYWTQLDLAKRTGTEQVPKHDLAAAFLDKLASIIEPFVGKQAYSIFRKDSLEFAARSPYFFIYKILPGSVAPVIILLAMRFNMEYIQNLSTYPALVDYALPSAMVLVLFIVIGQGNLFAGNHFGLEDAMIRSIMVFPVPRKAILLGKNLFLGGLFLLDTIVLSLLSLLFYNSAYIFFGIFTLLLTLFILILSIGNFTSSLWPYWMPFDKPSYTFRNTVILGLVNAGVTLVLVVAIAPVVAGIALPYRYEIFWLGYIFMPLAIFYGFSFHRLSLNPAVNVLENSEFQIIRRVADREQL